MGPNEALDASREAQVACVARVTRRDEEPLWAPPCLGLALTHVLAQPLVPEGCAAPVGSRRAVGRLLGGRGLVGPRPAVPEPTSCGIAGIRVPTGRGGHGR